MASGFSRLWARLSRGDRVGLGGPGRVRDSVLRAAIDSGPSTYPRRRSHPELPTARAQRISDPFGPLPDMGSVHLERHAAPCRLECWLALPRHVALRATSGRRRMDDESCFGVGSSGRRCLRSASGASLRTAWSDPWRALLHLHRLHVRTARAHRPRRGVRLHGLDDRRGRAPRCCEKCTHSFSCSSTVRRSRSSSARSAGLSGSSVVPAMVSNLRRSSRTHLLSEFSSTESSEATS